MPSPLCEVKDGAGAFASAVNGANVTPGNTVTIRLADSNVDRWELQCITTDDNNVASTVQAGLTIDALNKTATFTAPAEGAALRFRSRVQGGVNANGVTQAAYTTTFCVYTLVNGSRTVAVDETTEGGEFGWLSALNGIVRSGGAGVYPIHSLSALASPVTADEMGVYDVSAGTTKKITISQLPALVAPVANDITKQGGTDINRVQGLNRVPFLVDAGTAAADAAAPPIGGTWVYNELNSVDGFRAKKPSPPGHYDVQDYGAIPDYVPATSTYTTDNLAAFNACLAAMKADTDNAAKVMIVDGYYFLSDTLHIRQTCTIKGAGDSEPTGGLGAQRSGPGTWLVFPEDVDGIYFHHQGEALGGSDFSKMENLTVYCKYQRVGTFPQPQGSTTGNGIVVTCPVKLDKVNVQNFAENGVIVTAGNTSSYDVTANAGGFRLDGCRSGANGKNGYLVEGGDATVGLMINCSGTVNHGWGLKETTIGNTYVAHHCEGNRGFRPDLTSYYCEYYVRNGVDTNGSVMVGCYAEGTINELDSATQCIGGNLALKQNQIHQDLSQGLSASIGSRNAVAGVPLSFENTSGAETTLIEFGARADIGVDGIVLNFATPNKTDYTYLRYNDTNGWWEFDNASVGRPHLRFPTTTVRPRWVAPYFTNGFFLGTAETLNDANTSKSLISYTIASAVPTASGQTYEVGDFVWNKAVTTASDIGWSCTTAGTMGTLAGVTGSISSGSDQLTLNDTTNILRWQYITIAGVTGIKQIITDPVAGVVTISSAADATVSGAAVAFSAAAFTAHNRAALSIEGVSGTCALETTAATMQWASGTTSPTLRQADISTNGATAASMLVRAQSCTGTTSTGGSLSLAVGSGTSTNGFLNFRVAGSNAMQWTLATAGTCKLTAVSTVTAVTFDQSSVSGTGATWAFKGQSSSSGAGGKVAIGGNTGTTEYGQVAIEGPANVGRASQAMADANQTLSVANSAKNIILTTGALTATRTLTISVSPTDGVAKWVRNNCTGDSVTFQFLTGTGVTVAAGASALIGADGTNAYLVMGGT